jgi:hypothetical protein
MMLQKIHGYIAREIQHLTKDEDLRQELWLHILEGHSLFSLENHLKRLIKKRKYQLMLENNYGFKKKLQR